MKKLFKNKKRIIVFCIAIIVLVAAGVVCFFAFSQPTLEGDWEMVKNPETAGATPDEAKSSAKVYYTFESPDKYGEGVYKTIYDGGVEEGKYNLSEKGGKTIINLGTEDLVYKIDSSKLFGNSKLTITYPKKTDENTGEITPAQDYVFHQAKAPEYEKMSYDNYKTDSALSGEWKTTERKLSYYAAELSYTETVRFNDNGVMTIHYESKDLALDRYMYYAYTVQDKTLTFSLVTDKKKKYTVSYDFEKNGNLKFTKDNTSSSIFADAFFSDVIYKKSK